MIPAGSTTAAVNITIESDSVLEGTENFTATISTDNTGFPSVTAGDDNVATVNIQEDACACHLHVHVAYLLLWNVLFSYVSLLLQPFR